MPTDNCLMPALGQKAELHPGILPGRLITLVMFRMLILMTHTRPTSLKFPETAENGLPDRHLRREDQNLPPHVDHPPLGEDESHVYRALQTNTQSNKPQQAASCSSMPRCGNHPVAFRRRTTVSGGIS